MSRYKRYTPEMERFISDNAGFLTAQQIADHLCVKKTGIHSAIKRLGLNGRIHGENHHASKLSNLQVAMIITLHDSGFTLNEIYTALFFNHPASMQALSDAIAARTRKERSQTI